MRKILLSLFGLFVLAVAALLLVPGFIDWNDYKADIAAQIKNATGRDVVIEGDLNIRLLPSPAVLAEGVRLANLDGAASPSMAHLRVLEVRVAFAPLLGGNVQVEKVRLVDPLVALEILPDGRRNWDFQSSAPAVAGIPAGDDETGPAEKSNGDRVQLDAFAIQNGTFLYRDGRTGAAYEIEGVNAEVSARSLSGPFDGSGDLIFKGVPVTFETAVGRIDGDDVSVNAEVKVAPADVSAVLSGRATGLGTAPRVQGTFRLEGPGAGFASLGALAKTVPGFLGEDLILEGGVEADANGLTSENLTLRLGGAEATGRAALAFKGKDGVPAAEVNLKAARIDLDRWFGTGPVAVAALPAREAVRVSVTSGGRKLVAIPGTGEAAKAAAPTGEKEKGFLPGNLNATLTLGVDTITWRGDVISRAQAAMELANAEITVSQLSAVLPGVTNVAAFGFVAADADGGPVFEGDLEAGSSDLRGLARWFGVEDLGVPADRLRGAAFASKLRVTAREIQMPGIRLNVDQSRVSGGVTLALRKRLAFGADLAVDQINLDRYLAGGAGDGAAAGKASTGTGTEAGGGSGANEVSVLAAISTLDAFDTNLKVAIGAVTHKGRVYRKVALDSTLYNGELNLRDVSIGDMAGASLRFSGGLAGLGGLPEMQQATFDLTAPDPMRLARAFGVAAPGVLGRIGAVKFSGGAEGSFLKPRVDATLRAAGGEVLVKGALSAIPLTSLFDGRLAVRHEDFNQLLKTIGAGYRPAGALGGVDVAATVKLDPDAVSMSAIHGQIGPVPLEGRIDVGMAGARPNIKVDLQTGIVPVKAFLPAGEALKKPEGPSSARATSPSSSSSAPPGAASSRRIRPVSKRWSTDAIDFSALRGFDGDITLATKGVTFDTYSLEGATLQGALKKGVLALDRIEGTFFGGQVGGTARIDAAGAAAGFQGAVRLTSMDVAKATQAVSGKSLAAGRMAVNLDVSARGNTVAGMVTSLGGAGDFAITNLDVKEGGSGSVLSGVIGVFANLNAVISNILPLGKGEKGLADVSSRFTMKDGVATLADLSFVSPEGKGRATGTVDVAGWWLDVAGEVALPDTLLAQILARNTDKRSLPFTVKGDLDKPKVVLKTASLGSGFGKILDKTGIGKVLGTGTPEPSSAPAPGGSAPPPQVPPDQRAPDGEPKKIKPEDVLKGILKGVIQGQ